jgi:hypothetical protein
LNNTILTLSILHRRRQDLGKHCSTQLSYDPNRWSHRDSNPEPM